MNDGYGRTRRGFLQDALMSAAAVGLVGKAATAGEAKVKKAKWAIACRDAHLKEVGAADIWAAIKAIEVDGIEVSIERDGACPYISSEKEKFSIATEDEIKKLHDRLKSEKTRITAFCMGNHFDEHPESELEAVSKAAKAADALSIRAIRLDIVPRKMKSEDEFLTFAIDMGRKIVKASEGTKVRFGVENHGGTTNKPEFLRKLLDGVDSPRFGLTLDSGNFYWFGHPLSKLYDLYTEFAPRICHTHCKSIKYPEAEQNKQRPVGWEYGKYNAPIFDGDIDFARVASILRKGGYTGDLCIEDESLGKFPAEKRGEVLKREAELLRKVAGQA